MTEITHAGSRAPGPAAGGEIRLQTIEQPGTVGALRIFPGMSAHILENIRVVHEGDVLFYATPESVTTPASRTRYSAM